MSLKWFFSKMNAVSHIQIEQECNCVNNINILIIDVKFQKYLTITNNSILKD